MSIGRYQCGCEAIVRGGKKLPERCPLHKEALVTTRDAKNLPDPICPECRMAMEPTFEMQVSDREEMREYTTSKHAGASFYLVGFLCEMNRGVRGYGRCGNTAAQLLPV